MTLHPEPVDQLQPISKETLGQLARVRATVESRVVDECLREDAPQDQMGPQAEAMIATGMGFVSRRLRATMQYPISAPKRTVG